MPRCKNCYSIKADLRQLDGVPTEFLCIDEAACAARCEAQAQEGAPKLVLPPVDDTHDALWAMTGDGCLTELSMAEGLQHLIGKRVACIQQVSSVFTPQGPLTAQSGPNGVLLAVFADGFLLRNLEGKPIFVYRDKTMWVQEA